MTVLEMVKNLESQGHRIKYYVRKDGGILVQSIDGVSYKGASGNKVIRWMTGQELSKKRANQLQKITYGGKRKRKHRIQDDEVQKLMERVQRKWNKAFPHQRGEAPDVGLITTKKVNWNLEHKGREETIRLLKEAERYTKGIAYTENVNHLIERVEELYEIYGKKELLEIRDYLRKNIDNIREEWIQEAYQVLYYLNDGVEIESVIQILKSKLHMKN